MSRLVSVCVVATLAFVAVCDGAIIDFKTLKIDFADSENATAKATWSPADTLSISKAGLGWDGDGASSRDGWIQTKPLALGLSWRAPFVVSVRVAIHPPSGEIVLGNGQKYTPYGGDVYVRYGMSGQHLPPKDENAYKDRDSRPWRFKAEEKPDVGKPIDAGQALGVLETFLGALASKNFKVAYGLVAPSSKKHGDPIAYQASLDYKAFLGELSPHVEDDTAPPGGLRKFMEYELGKHRWESPDRLRVLVTFQGWDTDEVLIVREDGKWHVADPIHIIR